MSDSVRPQRRQPTRLPSPWDSPGKTTGVGRHFLLQCMKVKGKSLSCVRLFATPRTAAYQAPPSIGFSRQECWSGVPLPSPIYDTNYLYNARYCIFKTLQNTILFLVSQFSCSVISDSLRPHESQHARPPCPSPTPGVHSNSCPSNR